MLTICTYVLTACTLIHCIQPHTYVHTYIFRICTYVCTYKCRVGTYVGAHTRVLHVQVRMYIRMHDDLL